MKVTLWGTDLRAGERWSDPIIALYRRCNHNPEDLFYFTFYHQRNRAILIKGGINADKIFFTRLECQRPFKSTSKYVYYQLPLSQKQLKYYKEFMGVK